MTTQGIYINWDEAIEPACRSGALTIGNFDGVHRGHQALLAELKGQAQQLSGPAVVLTFDPHPVELLRPEQAPPLLTTIAQRSELLHQYGADCVFVLRTTRQLLQLSAREFFQRVIRDHFQPRVVVPGFNFAFGHNREGTVEKLAGFCQAAGIRFVEIPPLRLGEETVSSGRVRSALRTGDVRRAAELLGRPYSITGIVGKGQERGRQIGFPTANVQDSATMLPADGVYAGRVSPGGRPWPAAVNVGGNPTFGENARKVEVHILDFDGDLYGAHLTVDFIEHLRPTRPFAGVTELIEQLRRDCDRTRALVATGAEEPK